MRSKCYKAVCGLAIAAMTLGTPALVNAGPPCNNDWIIFLLLWYLFGGGQMGNGFPAGPGGWCCPPGGQPQPGPAPAPAPNGNGAMLRNGAGFMQRAPGMVNGGAANGNGAMPRNGAWFMQRAPGMVNGGAANGNRAIPRNGQGNGLPAIGQKPAFGQKPNPAGNGKAAIQPGKGAGDKPKVGPFGGRNMPAIGGKPNVGGKPAPVMKAPIGKPQIGRK